MRFKLLLLCLIIVGSLGIITVVSLGKFIRNEIPEKPDLQVLLLDVSAFPESWQVQSQLEDYFHPLSKHVRRDFALILPSNHGSALVSQDVWQADTVNMAQDRYEELLESQYQPSRPLNPGHLFVAFEPPSDIHLPTGLADESYLACKWWIWAYCQLVSRYQNYVVYLRLDQRAEFEGHITNGLTSQEIEAVIWAMDSKVAEVLVKSSQAP